MAARTSRIRIGFAVHPARAAPSDPAGDPARAARQPVRRPARRRRRARDQLQRVRVRRLRPAQRRQPRADGGDARGDGPRVDRGAARPPRQVLPAQPARSSVRGPASSRTRRSGGRCRRRARCASAAGSASPILMARIPLRARARAPGAVRGRPRGERARRATRSELREQAALWRFVHVADESGPGRGRARRRAAGDPPAHGRRARHLQSGRLRGRGRAGQPLERPAASPHEDGVRYALDTAALYGTPARVADQVAALRDAGVHHVLCQMSCGYLAPRDASWIRCAASGSRSAPAFNLDLTDGTQETPMISTPMYHEGSRRCRTASQTPQARRSTGRGASCTTRSPTTIARSSRAGRCSSSPPPMPRGVPTARTRAACRASCAWSIRRRWRFRATTATACSRASATCSSTRTSACCSSTSRAPGACA